MRLQKKKRAQGDYRRLRLFFVGDSLYFLIYTAGWILMMFVFPNSDYKTINLHLLYDQYDPFSRELLTIPFWETATQRFGLREMTSSFTIQSKYSRIIDYS
ncbi:hypothetical protein F2P56_017454, partial [Juglans regia]